MPAGRPTLSVGILTQNSAGRLGALFDHISAYCDEIVVGVDERSDRETYELACREADVVFQFEHTGISGPARLLPLAFSTSDWHLVLDDDERMDQRFPSLLPGLLSDPRYTHYFFPTKWIASTGPTTYFSGPPWWPDWHPRLMRNDLSLVWHSPIVHTEFQIQGLGCYEPGAALLHYERMLRPPAERHKKLTRYRALGMATHIEDLYLEAELAPRRELETYPHTQPFEPRSHRRPRQGGCKIIPQVQRVADRSSRPPLSAQIEVAMPTQLRAGQVCHIEVTARNSGALRWIPSRHTAFALTLGYHLKGHAGDIKVFDGMRTLLGQIVAPGEQAQFLAVFQSPKEPGDYLVEWDMVSEGECWFAECGSSTTRAPLKVI